MEFIGFFIVSLKSRASVLRDLFLESFKTDALGLCFVPAAWRLGNEVEKVHTFSFPWLAPSVRGCLEEIP